MKKIIGEFFRHFFSNPILPLLVILCSVVAMFFTADDREPKATQEKLESIRAVQQVRLSTIYSTAATTSTSTTSTSTTETTTTTVSVKSVPDGSVSVAPGGSNEPVPTAPQNGTTTEAAPDTQQQAEQPVISLPLTDYNVYSGADSPNSSFYQERLTILGDSIAYGFNAYGYIPSGHNIAKESMALGNMYKESFFFNLGGGAMNAVDATIYTNPSLVYISIGMNDIPGYNQKERGPDCYASDVYAIAQQIVDSVPDVTVVIGSITPVSANNYYTTNAIIDSFNYALETTVNSYASPQILYFNANSVLKDPATGAIYGSISGGDGLHVSGTGYGWVLNALFNYLDTTDTKSRIEAHEGTAE
ncbi:MAG: SGNH/GDSL hydrolase family protein [Ruminococcus sp.]|nr:SGNH/GDSL hydrolase family protein [Ruminococcus sp.]